uniref:Calcineurin-like phosphoesterase domain-containing protein n=1 Tax=viral metagenome TaxID=1070528 RepID=A0A6M3LGV4_9ZZZZ
MEADGKRHIIHGSRTDEFTIWNIADIHWMSRACAEGKVKEDIQRIADDPYSFWMGGGDYCEFIGHTDRRFDPDSVAPWVSVKDLGNLGKAGMEAIRDMFRPIRHKCLGLIIGNHEKQYELKKEHDGLHGWLCAELEVRNLEYCALFDLAFSRRGKVKNPKLVQGAPSKINGGGSMVFRIFGHHGAGYAQTPGGKLNKLIQFMQSFEADIYFAGHVHDRVGRREPTIGANAACDKLEAHERLGIISGSYLKTYAQGVTTYGEQRGYRPVSLGASWVRIKPHTRAMAAEV